MKRIILPGMIGFPITMKIYSGMNDKTNLFISMIDTLICIECMPKSGSTAIRSEMTGGD